MLFSLIHPGTGSSSQSKLFSFEAGRLIQSLFGYHHLTSSLMEALRSNPRHFIGRVASSAPSRSVILHCPPTVASLFLSDLQKNTSSDNVFLAQLMIPRIGVFYSRNRLNVKEKPTGASSPAGLISLLHFSQCSPCLCGGYFIVSLSPRVSCARQSLRRSCPPLPGRTPARTWPSGGRPGSSLRT